MNEETLYQSILNEAIQNSYNVYRNYGYVYSQERILQEVEMEYKSRIGKADYKAQSTKQETENKPKLKKLEDTRLELYKLDPDNNEEDRLRYNDIRKNWLISEEGTHPVGVKNPNTGKLYEAGDSYIDTQKKRTVGYGFNMDNKNNDRNISKIEWERAFPDENTRPSFDDVYNGQRKLNQNEMDKLFNYSVSSREQRLKNYIGQENWQQLKPNERLALESAWYNGETAIVGRNLRGKIQKYAQTGKEEDLKSAYNELAYNESTKVPYKNPELRARREQEGELLASHHDKQNYIEPSLARQMEESNKRVTVSIGQQIPNNLRTNQPYKDGDYFIWQHRSLKQNPNPLHLKEDGCIYKVGSDEWSWLNEKKWKGCMCVPEQVDYSKIEVV